MAEMTEQQINSIVAKAVEAALVKMGIDCEDPIEMQSDMVFLRKFKKSCDAIGSKIVMVIVGVATLAILGGVFVAIRKAFTGM